MAGTGIVLRKPLAYRIPKSRLKRRLLADHLLLTFPADIRHFELS
jgi:hypothetical protein